MLISVRIIVIPLARTGIDKINKIEVIIIDHENKFVQIIFIKLDFIKIKVIIKFNDLIIDEIPFI